MLPSVIIDVFWYAVIFLAAWLTYFLAHLSAARLGLLKGTGAGLVAIGATSAIVGGILAQLFVQAQFSSPAVGDLASITAPICFLGYWGIWFLLGPVGVDRSITITILSAFKAVEGKSLSAEQLMKAVPFDRIYQKRLQELSGVGVIELAADGVRVTPKGTRVLHGYMWLGRLLKVDPQ